MPKKFPVWRSEFNYASLNTQLMVATIGMWQQVPLGNGPDYADRTESWWTSFKVIALEASRRMKPFYDLLCRSGRSDVRIGDWTAASVHAIAFDLAFRFIRIVRGGTHKRVQRLAPKPPSHAFAITEDAFAGIPATALHCRRTPMQFPTIDLVALLGGLRGEQMATHKLPDAALRLIDQSELAKSLARRGILGRGRGRPTTDERDIKLAKEFAKFGGTHAAFHEQLMPPNLSVEGLRFAVRRGKKLIAGRNKAPAE